MKNAKYIICGIITVFIGIVVYQNQHYFFSSQRITIDLWAIDKYESPSFITGLLVLVCFFIGLFAAYLFGLVEKYKLKKSIRNLNADVISRDDQISSLENEIEFMKKKSILAIESDVKVPDHALEAPQEDTDDRGAEIADRNDRPEAVAGEIVVEAEDTIAETEETDDQTEDSAVKSDDV